MNIYSFSASMATPGKRHRRRGLSDAASIQLRRVLLFIRSALRVCCVALLSCVCAHYCRCWSMVSLSLFLCLCPCLSLLSLPLSLLLSLSSHNPTVCSLLLSSILQTNKECTLGGRSVCFLKSKSRSANGLLSLVHTRHKRHTERARADQQTDSHTLSSRLSSIQSPRPPATAVFWVAPGRRTRVMAQKKNNFFQDLIR